ncbi:MAG: hypothetical protein ABI895_03475 [Deltaproteobacteria bacterium]
MLRLYVQVAAETGRRALKSWPALLVLPAYPILLYVARLLTASVGFLGSILFSFVVAACWSSYLELISQAVTSSRFRLDWSEIKRSFVAHLWDVVSVLFVFWIIGMLTAPLLTTSRGPAISAIIGFAIAFFFNAVPELLYQGNSRSFALLADSSRFITEHPVVWLLPNVLLAALLLGATGAFDVTHPVEVLIAFGSIFSSPMGIIAVLMSFPLWAIPLVLVVLHTAMIFRGVLFRELASGGASARMRAFRGGMRD